MENNIEKTIKIATENDEITKEETSINHREDNLEDSLSSSMGSDGSNVENDGDGVYPDELEEGTSDSEGSVTLEREEGDGQESAPNKKVDDDEDKKNPQYIPKRGTFYEHDDRTLDDGSENQENVDKNDKQNKKSVWIEKKERWSHDRYNDNEQAPKSRAELVSIYGYDIRNEDGPPRARRRRRYGRGPNKYTRTWEDEDAYKPTKPVKTIPKKPKSKNDADNPALNNDSNTQSDDEPNVENFDNEDAGHEIINTNDNLSATHSDDTPQNVESRKTKTEIFNKRPISEEQPQLNYQPHQRPGTGRMIKPTSKPDIKEIKDSDYRGFTKTRQFRNSKSEQKILPKGQPKERRERHQAPISQQQQNVTQDIEKELSKMNIQDGVSNSKHSNKVNQRQANVPPRMQGEQKGSKRYSSVRQRSLPETAAPPYNPPPGYYGNEYNQPPQPGQQPLIAQPNPIHAAAPQVPQIAPPPLQPIPQVPVTASAILQAPPQFAGPFPQPPTAFLQPAVPPPPFLPQPPPPIINYVQGQPQFTPPPYQGYQHQQFNAVTQPAELYQCQGGTTYYSTQNQHLGQRFVPQKRPKAAIPIVPPPPQEPRGRGRTSNHADAIGDMCENVAHEGSNIYEDAAVVY